jgi:glycerophosphoryl diester phosphodiesterase
MVAVEFPLEHHPLVVAHRGASATYPENTLEAFDAAVSAGAPVVEFDVRLSSDAVPVVIHDADVSREAGHRWVLPNAIPMLDSGEAFVGEVHDAGMLVGTWVVDDREPFGRLLALGVDAVATNDPALGVAAREEFLGGRGGGTSRD